MNRISPGFHIPITLCGAATVALLATLSLFTPPTYARYVLEKGKDVEVCVAYEKALNGSREVTSPYSRPMDPKAKHFSKPKWEPLVIGEYPFLEKVWRYRFDRDVNPVISFYGVDLWRQWRGTKEQYAYAWESYLVSGEKRGTQSQYLARFDIDNDGQVETIYLDQAAHMSLFVVLNKDQADFDYDMTERAQGHPPRKAMGLGEFRPVTKTNKNDWGVPPTDIALGITPVPDAASNASYDFFFYKGKTYYDLWWDNHPSYRGKPPWDVGRLQVFMLEKRLRAREICTYRIHREDPRVNVK